MRLLIISDIHGDIENINKLNDEFAKADTVIFAGDFAKFNEIETGLPTLQCLLEKHNSILAVLGNCDEPDFIEKIEDEDICIQKSLVFKDGLAFAGSGGALKFTETTPNELSDEELFADLKILEECPTLENLVLVTHQPPFDTGMDKITAGISTGSKLIRQLIEGRQPLVAISGHIHESFATSKLGNTTLMNPGSLAEGRYGIIEIEKIDGKMTVTKAELCLV